MRRRIILAVTGVIAVLVLIIGLSMYFTSFDRTDGGQIAVVRNGGPLDNNQIRQTLQPGSARTYVGLYSTSHKYPSQQRFYTITSDPKRGDRSGVDVEQDPTSDGVEIGIEGTIYFNLNLDKATIESFDNKYGTRTYPGFGNATAKHAWDGDEGWDDFLDAIVRPVVSNDLREQIGDFRCSELQAACALVQNNGSNANSTKTADIVSQGQKNNVNIAKIQDAINTSLADDLKSTLGGDFFTNVHFNLSKITLPSQVQTAINNAQAAFAAVTEAQAKVAQATADASANTQREKGYEKCPACATIDTLKAIPPTVTTFAPGAGFAITQPGK